MGNKKKEIVNKYISYLNNINHINPMEFQSLFGKIKSRYIAADIFLYVKDGNFFLKLIKYCKKLQTSFNLGIEVYKKKGFELVNYPKYEKFLLYEKEYKYFNENYLKNKFNEDIKKYGKIIKNTISNEFSEIFFTNKYYNNKAKEQINKKILDKQFIIDIYSPFYEILSRNPIFQNLFVIRIPMPLIKNKKLIKDYIEAFKILNERNFDYSAICLEFDAKIDQYLSCIQKCNIDFKKIKKLTFQEKKQKDILGCKNISLFKELFSNKDIINHLVFLEIKKRRNQNTILLNVLDNINDFKCLEELKLENLDLDKICVLKLKTLKYLSLCNCCQISISEECALNLKSLSLFRSRLQPLNSSKLKFHELEQLKISFCYYDGFYNYDEIYNYDNSSLKWYEEFQKIVDFKSLKKLKFLYRGDISVLFNLDNNSLEKAYISSYTLSLDSFFNFNKKEIYKEAEKQMIKKFIDIKTLKEIKFSLNFINNKDIESIEGENPSVKKLIIDWHCNDNNDNLIYNLQKKFPNLLDIEIYDYNSNIHKINLEPNCKMERFKYSGGKFNDKFSIHSFENLKVLELKSIPKTSWIENIIPIFSKHYDCNFKSLIKFVFDNSNMKSMRYHDIALRIITNVVNNLNKIPSLKCFIFKCYSQISLEDYHNLIKKVLSLKIKSIEFGINCRKNLWRNKYFKDEYTEIELQSLFEKIDFKYFENIKIYKG